MADLRASVDELETKAKSIFADHVIKVGTFAVKTDSKKKSKTSSFNFTQDVDENNGPYGNLFKKK